MEFRHPQTIINQLEICVQRAFVANSSDEAGSVHWTIGLFDDHFPEKMLQLGDIPIFRDTSMGQFQAYLIEITSGGVCYQ